MTSTPYIEFQDLVRHTPTNRLGFIERVAGDSSDDDDDYSDGDAASDDTSSTTDERGRWTRWVAGAPSATSSRARRDATGRVLISRYDDDDDEGDDDEPPLPADLTNGEIPKELPDGTAVLTLVSTGEKIVRPVEELCPLDRHFDPAQIVTWAPDAPDAPRQATVENPDPATLFEVPSERLGFFCGLRAGDTVVRGSWVGVVDYFQEDVFVEFSDGAIACVPGHRKALRNVDRRTPDRNRPDPFSEGMYYPGQRVRSLPEVWKSIVRWIRGGYTGKDEGIVKAVKVGDVGIEWVAKSLYADQNEDDSIGRDVHERGTEVVQFSEITLLESFRNLWWTVGDRAILLDADNVGTSEAKDHEVGGHVEGRQGLPNFGVGTDDDDGEWEEEEITESHAGASSATDMPSRFLARNRAVKRQGGRLMKAQRKARERGGSNGQVTTVSDAALVNASDDPEDVVQVVGTKSRVTVLWQDGTRSENMLALNFRVNNHPDPYDFWPGEIVLRQEDGFGGHGDDEDERGSASRSQRKGAVVRVNQNERTAIVRWQKEDQTGYEGEEEVSVYELQTDEYDVNVGDTVLHTPKDSSPSEKRKEWVGVIINQSMGKCTVAWYGGTVSSVPVRELLYISGGDEETYDAGFSTTDAESDGIAEIHGTIQMGSTLSHVPQDPEYHHNWGLEEDAERMNPEYHFVYGKTVINDLFSTAEAKVLREAEEQEVETVMNATVLDITDTLKVKRYDRNGSLQRTRISKTEERLIATKMTYHVLSGLSEIALKKCLAGTSPQSSDSSPTHQRHQAIVDRVKDAYHRVVSTEASWLANQGESRNGPHEIVMEDANICKHCGGSQDAANDTDEVTPNGVTNSRVREYQSQEDCDSRAGRFKLVEELKDFHMFSSVSSSSSCSAGFLSVVHREWNRLEKNLPPGVRVWTSENEVDKLRAAIVGPQDTPYDNVIFFFDIRLGPTYPMSPPLVWFHSHGKRINPNLYEDGKVCLSILGTWDGDDVESWDAKTSNLLRVLLSLQALVFVEEPYYNEAGYSKQRGTEEGYANSRMYNESAYLLCMRHILQSLRPGGIPVDCARVATAHYKKVGAKLIERSRQLVRGEGSSGFVSEGRAAPYSSAGFRKSLAGLLKGLEEAVDRLE